MDKKGTTLLLGIIEKEQKGLKLNVGLKRKLFHYFQYLYIYKIRTFMVKKGTKTLNED